MLHPHVCGGCGAIYETLGPYWDCQDSHGDPDYLDAEGDPRYLMDVPDDAEPYHVSDAEWRVEAAYQPKGIEG